MTIFQRIRKLIGPTRIHDFEYIKTNNILILKHISGKLSLKLEKSKVYLQGKPQNISKDDAGYLFDRTQDLLNQREMAVKEFLQYYDKNCKNLEIAS